MGLFLGTSSRRGLQLSGDSEEFVGIAFPHAEAAMLLSVSNSSSQGGGNS
jgi:hypothetical protein